jgi:hypothetical protein
MTLWDGRGGGLGIVDVKVNQVTTCLIINSRMPRITIKATGSNTIIDTIHKNEIRVNIHASIPKNIKPRGINQVCCAFV